jgi:hypothetical protein
MITPDSSNLFATKEFKGVIQNILSFRVVHRRVRNAKCKTEWQVVHKLGADHDPARDIEDERTSTRLRSTKDIPHLMPDSPFLQA